MTNRAAHDVAARIPAPDHAAVTSSPAGSIAAPAHNAQNDISEEVARRCSDAEHGDVPAGRSSAQRSTGQVLADTEPAWLARATAHA